MKVHYQLARVSRKLGDAEAAREHLREFSALRDKLTGGRQVASPAGQPERAEFGAQAQGCNPSRTIPVRVLKNAASAFFSYSLNSNFRSSRSRYGFGVPPFVVVIDYPLKGGDTPVMHVGRSLSDIPGESVS